MPIDIDSTIQVLLDQGVTVDQFQSAAQKNTFDTQWAALQTTMKTVLPSCDATQLAAFKAFIDNGSGFDASELERVGRKVWELVLAGNTTDLVPAFVILVATVYKVRPDFLTPQ